MRRAVINLRDIRPVWAAPEWAIAEIAAALDDLDDIVVVDAAADGRGDGGEVAPAAFDAVRGAEIYLGFGLPQPLFLAATEPPHGRLRWAHTGTAGVGALLYPELRESDVILTNSAGVHAEPMAEWAIGAMLHFARGFDIAVRAQAAAQWRAAPFESLPPAVREVAGATLGIVGFGGTGRALAWRAYALGMRIVATRRRAARTPPPVELITGDDALGRLLEQSDFVTLATPSTPETRGLIGRAAIDRMKHGAVLINLARGDLVDDVALIAALRSGRLRGAALDVFTTEPLPADSPLWPMPNVLITPHVSATSTSFWRRQTDLIVENVRRYLAGERLRNVVDKRSGY